MGDNNDGWIDKGDMKPEYSRHVRCGVVESVAIKQNSNGVVQGRFQIVDN